MLDQPLSTQRHIKKVPQDEERLVVERIIYLSSQYGRYGYRRITALLQNEGWTTTSALREFGDRRD